MIFPLPLLITLKVAKGQKKSQTALAEHNMSNKKKNKKNRKQQRCLYQFHSTICFPLVDAVRRNSKAKRVASAIVYLGPVLAIIIVAVVVMTPINAIIMKIFSIIEFCYRFSNLSKLFLGGVRERERGSALCFLHSPFSLFLSMIYGLCTLTLSLSLPPTLSLSLAAPQRRICL